MDIREAMKSVLTAFVEGHVPSEDAVALLVNDTSGRRRVLAHPVLAAKFAEFATKKSGLACEDVRNALAAYISAQRRGNEPQAYEDVGAHLRLCVWCFEEYRTTADVIDAQSVGTLPPWPQTLNTAVVSIPLPQDEIRQALLDWRRPVLARGDDEVNRRWLFCDSLPGRPDVFAEVALVRPADLDSDEWRICVTLRGDEVADITLYLEFGGEMYAQRTDALGEACFEDLPAASLQTTTAPALHIAVKAH